MLPNIGWFTICLMQYVLCSWNRYFLHNKDLRIYVNLHILNTI